MNETLATPVSKTAPSLYPDSSPRKDHYNLNFNDNSFQEEEVSVSKALDMERDVE